METNNHQIADYDAALDAKFGKQGSLQRAEAEQAARRHYNI